MIRFRNSRILFLFAIIFALPHSRADAQVVKKNVPVLDSIDVIEHLGAKLPLNLSFTDDSGQDVLLSSYFGRGRPVVLVLAYYECPMLCTLVLNGLAKGVDELGWVPGDDYSLLTVSIDPSETPQLAASKKKNLLESIGMSATDKGWTFFVGNQQEITALADAVGFKYFYDEKRKEYAHPALAVVLGDDGMISRYLYGIEFKKQDLKLALVEASKGKIGSAIDRIILYCYHYDPAAGGYVLFAGNLMKLGGFVTLAFMAILLTALWMKDLRRKAMQTAAHL
jgi:protein SCO1/2